MEGIEFEKEEYIRPLTSISQVPRKSWAIKLVTKISGGRIKTEEQASHILLVLVIVLIVLSIYNFAFSGKKNKASSTEIQRVNIQMEETLRSARNN